MPAESTKDRLIEAMQQLPPDTTIEQAMEQLYFLAKVQRGIQQADAGQTISHEEARRRLLG
jgi:predicted transcriptional regulator